MTPADEGFAAVRRDEIANGSENDPRTPDELRGAEIAQEQDLDRRFRLFAKALPGVRSVSIYLSNLPTHVEGQRTGAYVPVICDEAARIHRPTLGPVDNPTHVYVGLAELGEPVDEPVAEADWIIEIAEGRYLKRINRDALWANVDTRHLGQAYSFPSAEAATRAIRRVLRGCPDARARVRRLALDPT